MAESQRIAQEGGNVARDARQTMERRLGRSVVSPERASDYIKPIDSEAHDTLPPAEDIKKVERRVAKDEKEMLKDSQKLPKVD